MKAPGICLMSLRVTGSLPSPYQRQPIFIGIVDVLRSYCFAFMRGRSASLSHLYSNISVEN